MNLKNLRPTFNANVDIEFRLFELTLFLSALIFLVWLVIALLADYILQIQITYFVCLLLFSSLYIAFKQKVSFHVVASIYYTSALVVVLYSWFPSGGVSGVILLMLVLIYMSGLLVLPIKGFLYFIVISLITLISFSILELQNIRLALSYMSDFDRVRDFSIAGFITLSTLGYTMYIFKKTYLQDRVQLKKTIIALERETKKAQSADKAKSDFLATISHEMRTPLNGIVGITDLLKETSLNKDQQYLISNLSYSSEFLHSLISDILDVTLIESGELNLHNDLININEEIEKVVELVRPKILKKTNKVEIVIQKEDRIPIQVIGDILRFRQVLLNLINNAIKFTNEGFITISSTLVNKTDKEIRVKFAISDTGFGISEEEQKKLFNRFFKGSRDSNIEGTGLGLSISKNLVTLMGGDISFSSVELQGSTFFFELPFKIHDDEISIEKVDVELKNKPLKEVRILIAEDVRINHIVLKRLVESLGLTNIDIVENGEEAVQKVKENWYDVILMDIQMPIMNGLEASEKISKFYNEGKKPIILAVTANVFSINQEDYRKVGINGTLSKPITKESLREILSKFI